MSSGFYRSDSLSNLAAVIATAKWYPPLDETKLNNLPFDDRFWDYAKILNNSGEVIKVTLGDNIQTIRAGDWFEWTKITPVRFTYAEIENLDAANQIEIGELIFEYGRYRDSVVL